jgi:hypothetical protein
MELPIMQVDETCLKVLARFTAELIAEMERQPRHERSWPAWFAAMHRFFQPTVR